MRKQVLALATLICLVSIAWCAPLPERLPPKMPPVVVEAIDVDDLARFPAEVSVREAVLWSRAHRDWIEKQIGLTHPINKDERQFWSEWLADAERAGEPWETLAWAMQLSFDGEVAGEDDGPDCGCCSTTSKWYRLYELRRSIGDDAYARGAMPSPVPPAWRFRRID